jgi:hypothetical protein
MIAAAVAAAPVDAQKKGKPVLWEPVNIESRDTFLGPGGKEWQPDLSKIEFIRNQEGGHNTKYRIKDGKGRVWVAKLGREAQPETAAVRLTWALGYKSEVNYLVPEITIPGKGTHKNVRLEARPDHIDRLEEWKWRDNPFVGTNELEGLKMLMVFMTNWDVLDLQNKVLHNEKTGELEYIVSDLGATFGKLGNNNLPIIYRLGRSTGNPRAYVNGNFVVGLEDDDPRQIDVSYKGKNKDLFEGFTVSNGRWLASLLNRLSDKQIRDAFRAARYTPSEIEMFTQGVKARIAELNEVISSANVAQQ